MKEKCEKEKRKKQKTTTLQTAIWTVLILIQMTTVYRLDVKAQEVTVYSPYYEQEADVSAPEPEHRMEDGEVMRLLWWETVPVVTPSRRRTMELEVVYHDVERITQIPQEIQMEAKDNGQKSSDWGRLVEQRDLNEQWQAGFQFTLTFHHYQADFYQVGEVWIPNREEDPALDGYEAQILKLIGVSPEEYQITGAVWAGEPYEDENGIRHRDALVFGKKLVREVLARYQKEVEFEPKTMWQTVAVYGSIRESETETAEIRRKESQIVVVEKEELQEEKEDLPPSLWQRIIQTLFFTIALGALLFLGGLLILAVLTLAKKIRAWYNRST